MLLKHPPAKVIRSLLITAGVGTASGSWPIYYANEPKSPDEVITIFDTTGVKDSRVMQGDVEEYHGYQVRVRASTYDRGYAKVDAAAKALDAVVRQLVTLDVEVYMVHTVMRTSPVMHLRTDKPDSKLDLFVVNGLLRVTLSA